MMEFVIDFFNHPFFIIIGGITTLGALGSLFYLIFLIFRGVIPVWYRLAMGLTKRKIAIFAEDEYKGLKNILVDSKIFNEKNIIHIDKNHIKKAESITLLLVHWDSFKNKLDEIMNIKKDSDALIIYAPQKDGRIDGDAIDKLNYERNTIIVNFRGRLLNDVLTSMITTSYKDV